MPFSFEVAGPNEVGGLNFTYDPANQYSQPNVNDQAGFHFNPETAGRTFDGSGLPHDTSPTHPPLRVCSWMGRVASRVVKGRGYEDLEHDQTVIEALREY